MSANSKELRVEFSLTVNLGNFNSAKLGCVLTDSIEKDEEFEDKFDQIYGRIRTKVRKELAMLTHKVEDVVEENPDG